MINNPDNLRLGIDLGGSKIEAAVITAGHHILLRQRINTPKSGYCAILHAIAGLIGNIESELGLVFARIGIGSPGTLSRKTARIINANTQCLQNKPLDKDLEELLRKKIKLANDANCFTLAESCIGAGRGYSMVFGVILGTGVGGGICIDGRIHEGMHGIAGEWGHNILHGDGIQCYCGKHGCVEQYLAGPAVEADYLAKGARIPLSAEKIAKAAVSTEDSLAVAVMERFIENFGKAMAMVINILDPDIIILGGGLSNIDQLYTTGIKAVEDAIFSDQLLTPISRHQQGDSAGVLGAAMLWSASQEI